MENEEIEGAKKNLWNDSICFGFAKCSSEIISNTWRIVFSLEKKTRGNKVNLK